MDSISILKLLRMWLSMCLLLQFKQYQLIPVGTIFGHKWKFVIFMRKKEGKTTQQKMSVSGIDAVRHNLNQTKNSICKFNSDISAEISNAQKTEDERLGEFPIPKYALFPSQQYKCANISINDNHTQTKGQNHNKKNYESHPTARENSSEIYFPIRYAPVVQPKTICRKISPVKYFPPACSGYDMAYLNGRIFIYGGISCTAELGEGLKQHFYQCHKDKWIQVKPESMYCPVTRFGHTLTAFNDSYLILFGGVSEYKEKLKDRCFYSDVWTYNVIKNTWKIIEFAGGMIKNRKNHSACIYKGYYLVYGGVDESEEIINELSWVNFANAMSEEKEKDKEKLNSFGNNPFAILSSMCSPAALNTKNRWRSKKLEARYNHQMLVFQSQSRDYLAVCGGRNAQSDIIGDLALYQIGIVEGELIVRDHKRITHGYHLNEKIEIMPREMPIMACLSSGIVILGGSSQNNEHADSCWFYNPEKGAAEKLEQLSSEVNWGELRGARGVSVEDGKSVYILSGSNTKKYKALEITLKYRE